MSNKTKQYGLLVIDMQEHFRDCAIHIIPELNKTIEMCNSKQIPIFYTQHGHRYLDEDGGVLASWWGHDNSIKYNSEAWQLLPELNLPKNNYFQIVEKRRYDAFYGTLLQDMLHVKKVDTVIISGVMTNLCCETTARSAFVRDFNVVFLSDGTGTTSDDMHQATLKNISFGFGQVTSCSNFRKLLA